MKIRTRNAIIVIKMLQRENALLIGRLDKLASCHNKLMKDIKHDFNTYEKAVSNKAWRMAVRKR